MADTPVGSPGRWHTLSVMGWRDRLLLAQASVLLVLVRAGLAVLTFQRLYGVLTWTYRPRPATATSAQRVARVRAIARVVGMASRHVPFAGACLQRSLVLWWMLRRRDLDSAIRFGVRRTGGQLLAHAWVEFDGLPAEDADRDADREYVAMPWLPADRSL